MNVVLIIILIAIVVLAAVSGAKHFKGQGGCCGGGGELRPEHKKLDGPVTEEKIISTIGKFLWMESFRIGSIGDVILTGTP